MKKNSQKGFLLGEMLIYIAIMTLMLGVIASMLTSMVRTERIADSSKAVENAAVFGLERIVREIRDASAVVAASSTLDVSPGVLVLSGTDVNGATKTTKFFLTQGILHVEENGIDKGPLTQSNTNVTSLVFSLLSNSNSASVKTTITVESGTSTTYKKETFYSTTLMRGSI